MHFRDNTRAAERAADESGLVPHVLVRLLRPEDRLAIPKGEAHTLPDCVRFFAREGEHVGQEGFDALVHIGADLLCLMLQTFHHQREA